MSKTLERILYVEDEGDIQKVAQVALETLGKFELLICSSGREALEQAEAFAPDLLLLDVMMPGMDGPTTLEALRKIPALQQTPVMFMTAKVQPQEIAHFKTLGAIEVLTKPFEAMKLAQQIRDIWAKHFV
ncbi:MAG: response regulator [Gammaproteobacteria bacterium]|nr:response regulator [Gammaproteobacteria bacterium]MDH5650268.1 response regulator [Gammaproteobacteria bacterium]